MAMTLTGITARTLDAISRAIRADLRREMPEADATIWPNNMAILSKVFAMATRQVELRLEWAYRQLFASTADARQLERHAYEFGLARKAPAAASGYIDAEGTADTIYPAGLAWISGTARYIAAADALSGADGAVRFYVVAEATGAATNRGAGEELAFADAAAAPTLSAVATVGEDGLGGGADTESDDSLRARVLDRKRRPPQGGATSDYEQIARAYPGVSAAWAYAWSHGPGTVGVWFLFDGRPDGIPTDADVAAVQDWIDTRRLIRARLVVAAPVAAPVDVFISGLTTDTLATRSAIEASLRAMFAARARPGVASAPLLFSRSWISEAISQAIGEDQHYLSSPQFDLVFAAGEMPVLGQVFYG